MRERRTGRRAVRGSLGPGDVRSVYRTGSRHATAVATIHIRADAQRGWRVAVPVGKRLGSAVVRNRVRRRLREAFREVEREARSGGDIVIVARSAATTVPFKFIVGELRKALIDIGLIGFSARL